MNELIKDPFFVLPIKKELLLEIEAINELIELSEKVMEHACKTNDTKLFMMVYDMILILRNRKLDVEFKSQLPYEHQLL